MLLNSNKTIPAYLLAVYMLLNSNKTIPAYLLAVYMLIMMVQANATIWNIAKVSTKSNNGSKTEISDVSKCTLLQNNGSNFLWGYQFDFDSIYHYLDLHHQKDHHCSELWLTIDPQRSTLRSRVSVVSLLLSKYPLLLHQVGDRNPSWMES